MFSPLRGTSVEEADPAYRDLVAIGSPDSSEFYADSPQETVRDDDNNSKGCGEKTNNGSFLSMSSDASSHSEIDFNNAAQQLKKQLFRGANEESALVSEDKPLKELDNDDTISPFTRELITRSRIEMERRRQKRLANWKIALSQFAIVDHVLPEEQTNEQENAPLSPKNPFDDASLVAQSFSDKEQLPTETIATTSRSLIETNTEAGEGMESCLIAENEDIATVTNDFVEGVSTIPEVLDSQCNSSGTFPDISRISESDNEQTSALEERILEDVLLPTETIAISNRNQVEMTVEDEELVDSCLDAKNEDTITVANNLIQDASIIPGFMEVQSNSSGIFPDISCISDSDDDVFLSDFDAVGADIDSVISCDDGNDHDDPQSSLPELMETSSSFPDLSQIGDEEPTLADMTFMSDHDVDDNTEDEGDQGLETMKDIHWGMDGEEYPDSANNDATETEDHADDEPMIVDAVLEADCITASTGDDVETRLNDDGGMGNHQDPYSARHEVAEADNDDSHSLSKASDHSEEHSSASAILAGAIIVATNVEAEDEKHSEGMEIHTGMSDKDDLASNLPDFIETSTYLSSSSSELSHVSNNICTNEDDVGTSSPPVDGIASLQLGGSEDFFTVLNDDENGLIHKSTIDAPQPDNPTRNSFVTQTHPSLESLDVDAVFRPKRKRSTASGNKSSQPSMASSLSLSLAVFGNQQDPCCFRRRGWLVFVILVILFVIVVAALVDRKGSASIPADLPSFAPSRAPSNNLMTDEPSMASSESTPRPTIANIPTKQPTPSPTMKPAVFPPFSFNLTAPPNMQTPPPSEADVTPAPSIFVSFSPDASPTSEVPTVSLPPFAHSILTYPPFTRERPSGRNLRFRIL